MLGLPCIKHNLYQAADVAIMLGLPDINLNMYQVAHVAITDIMVSIFCRNRQLLSICIHAEHAKPSIRGLPDCSLQQMCCLTVTAEATVSSCLMGNG